MAAEVANIAATNSPMTFGAATSHIMIA